MNRRGADTPVKKKKAGFHHGSGSIGSYLKKG